MSSIGIPYLPLCLAVFLVIHEIFFLLNGSSFIRVKSVVIFYKIRVCNKTRVIHGAILKPCLHVSNVTSVPSREVDVTCFSVLNV
ncbi:MAG: hypothetical protein ACJARF_000652 [Alteromonadaceae bacterium]|jgi:hypothetical protein